MLQGRSKTRCRKACSAVRRRAKSPGLVGESDVFRVGAARQYSSCGCRWPHSDRGRRRGGWVDFAARVQPGASPDTFATPTRDREMQVPLEPREMLTVFVFDERESRREKDLRPALDQLGEKALL